jgi:hypothetical protein
LDRRPIASRGEHVRLRAAFALHPETRRMGAGRDLFGLRKDHTEFPVELGLRVRRKLAGADDGNRQMVDILTAVITDGLPAVEAACTEAIAQGVHSADVVLNILARQRDPAPPASILTPAALTLQQPPIADCARYDNLRRTN